MSSLKVTSPVQRLMISGCTLDQISGVSVLNFIRQRQGVLKMPDQLTHLSASSIIPEVPLQAASVVTWIGSSIDASSFSGLLTRLEIGHIRISSGGNGRIRSRGSASSPSQRA
jgi:hypothetical protein